MNIYYIFIIYLSGGIPNTPTHEITLTLLIFKIYQKYIYFIFY